MISPEISDIQCQSTAPPPAPLYVPPTLRAGQTHHVFISSSSTDYLWTHAIIDQLESCGLQVCYHERDFIPGRTVLENMTECIHESQKVLLVLSPEFVRSRWCLLEANMSLFRDCLERKPIIPVLLDPGVSVPLHLCHLTYLEASDPNFMEKLLKVLCTPNQQLQGSTVVPFQPPSIYNGKALQPLIAVNEEGLSKWDCGRFSEMEVPDQLRLVIKDQEKYKQAVRTINNVSEHKVWLCSTWRRVLVYITGAIVSTGLTTLFGIATVCWMGPDPRWEYWIPSLVLLMISVFCCPLGLFIQLCLWKKDDEKYILREMQKAMGQANIILSEEKVLMGCRSNKQVYLVYVCLDGCKREFAETFSEQVSSEEMFHRAVLFFSSGYVCCLSKRDFPFPHPVTEGHLDGMVCFCQYVSQQLRTGQWE